METLHFEKHMRRCLELARQGEGRTSPNPAVGALILNAEGEVVGEGFHAQAGAAHAEVIALEKAGALADGGTLFVSLEPCNHYGKTPPCVEAVIAAGIKCVVASAVDPNPRVSGQGFARLRAAGINVVTDVCRQESLWLNRGFLSRVVRQRPWLCLKLAATLDGKIADRFGTSRWITGSQARGYVHQLRNTFDAVLVGSTTARLDDPELTVRDLAGGRNPWRLIVKGKTPLPSNLKVLSQNLDGKTLVFGTGKDAGAEYETITVAEKNGQPDLKEVVSYLAQTGINTVLCEGGAKLASSLLAEELVDEVNWFMATKILGDAEAKPVLTGDEPKNLADACQLKNISTERFDDDILVRGVLAGNFMFSSGFLLPATDADRMG